MFAMLLLGATAQGTEIGQERTLGLGATLGTATGITGRAYLGTRRVALGFAYGATSRVDVYDAAFGQLSVHLVSPLVEGDGVEVKWRVGLGAFATTFGDETALGGRLPVGLDLDLRSRPVQVSLDASPVSVTIGPPARFGLDAGLAVRYYL